MASSNSPSLSIKSEPTTTSNQNFYFSSDSQSQSTSESTQRLSFVENQDSLRQICQRNIYIGPMRSFLARVKQNCANLKADEELRLLLLTVSCIDLTTLAGDDTATNVERLCYRAKYALDIDETDTVATTTSNNYKETKCAAVCVYPSRVVDCVHTFKRLNENGINIAAVATGFPSGQFGLKSRLAEVKDAVESGANEIDVVINRPAAIGGNWALIFDEISQMRKACDIRADSGHHVHLKVIIGAGDLLTSTPSTIYNASLVAILAGANFIKTSTGKESVNATLPIGYIMMRCIVDYYNLTGIKIGFKPAGGIRTYQDALNWLMLVKMLLGPDWLNNKLFRFGASGLLDDVEKRIRVLCKLKSASE
uniref:deoxyribose-phosphate aldolase n=1 Tax=Aceria tosichella TaxID=561515 RepID=A0A6G1SH71_9ACAR